MRTFTINWITLLALVSLWTYGIFGFLTPPAWGLLVQIPISLLLLAVILLLFRLRKNLFFTTHIEMTVKDLRVFLLYFLIMFVCAYSYLSDPIDGDQLYHSQQAMAPTLKVVGVVTSYTSIFDTVSLSHLVWLGNILLLIVGVVSYRLLKKRSNFIKGIVLTLFFVAARSLAVFTAGNAVAFPTFRLFPIWLTGTVFSPSAFGFRMATFLGLLILMWWVYRKVREKFGEMNAILFGLFAGTIPVLFHVGNLVEPSLWAAFCFTATLFMIDAWSEGKRIPYVPVMCFIVIMSMMRVSAFVALVPLGLMMLLDWKLKKVSTKEVISACIPVLLLFPIIIASFIIGTPSTYVGDVPLLTRLSDVILTGGFVTYVYNSLHYPLVLFLIVLPLILLKDFKKWFLAALLFLCGFIIFYSINPVFFGHGRYQAEYLVPFVIFGAYAFFLLFAKHTKLVMIALILLIGWNIRLYENIPRMNGAVRDQGLYSVYIQERGKYFVLSEFPYNATQALETAKEAGYAGQVYYAPGNGYGYFSEMLAGYSVSEMRKEKALIDSVGVNLENLPAKTINANKNIQLVLVNGSENNHNLLPQKLADDLKKLGWKDWQTFTNEKFGTSVYGIQRK